MTRDARAEAMLETLRIASRMHQKPESTMPYLRDRRIAAGLTRNGAADMLGIARHTWTGWEVGRCCPRACLLPEIAEALHCTIAELFQPVEVRGHEG